MTSLKQDSFATTARKKPPAVHAFTTELLTSRKSPTLREAPWRRGLTTQCRGLQGQPCQEFPQQLK